MAKKGKVPKACGDASSGASATGSGTMVDIQTVRDVLLVQVGGLVDLVKDLGQKFEDLEKKFCGIQKVVGELQSGWMSFHRSVKTMQADISNNVVEFERIDEALALLHQQQHEVRLKKEDTIDERFSAVWIALKKEDTIDERFSAVWIAVGDLERGQAGIDIDIEEPAALTTIQAAQREARHRPGRSVTPTRRERQAWTPPIPGTPRSGPGGLQQASGDLNSVSWVHLSP